MKTISILSLCHEVVEQSMLTSQFSKAHLCRSSVNSFICFLGSIGKDGSTFTFRHLSPELVANYERWLLADGKAYNTVSTYIRNLQTLYNIAVDRRLARYNRLMFRGRIKGYQCRHLRVADDTELQKLTTNVISNQLPNQGVRPLDSDVSSKVRMLFWLQVLLCGIPFVDLVHLRVGDIVGDRLVYRRQKTDATVRLRLSPEALALIEMLRRKESGGGKERKEIREGKESKESIEGREGRDGTESDILLDVLPVHSSMNTEQGWREYQSCLAWYNRNLRKMALALGIGNGCNGLSDGVRGITSYVARHTWADRAQRCGIDTKMIMELLGHSRITTTLYYLRNFDFDNVAKAQQKVMEEIVHPKQKDISN